MCSARSWVAEESDEEKSLAACIQTKPQEFECSGCTFGHMPDIAAAPQELRAQADYEGAAAVQEDAPSSRDTARGVCKS